jgi:hypothetical protein
MVDLTEAVLEVGKPRAGRQKAHGDDDVQADEKPPGPPFAAWSRGTGDRGSLRLMRLGLTRIVSHGGTT